MKPASLAVLCMINNDRQHSLSFVRHYAGIEGCRLILFLDAPEHLAYFENEDFGDSLVLQPCTDEHWQQEIGRAPRDMPEKQHTNIRKGARLASELGCRWCVSVDSDELILNLQDLVLRLDQLGEGADLLRLMPAELIHSRASAFSDQAFSGRYFKICLPSKKLTRVQKKLGKRLQWRLKRFKPVTRRLFFGHTNGKTVFSLDAPITTYKQHTQFSDERELVEVRLPDDYVILHYDAMNYQSWIAKWSRRISGSTRATAISDQRKMQTHLIARSLGFMGGYRSRRLFSKWFVFNKREISAMNKAGMLIDIGEVNTLGNK